MAFCIRASHEMRRARTPRLRCHPGYGGINKAVSLLRLLRLNRVRPSTIVMGRRAKGYSRARPCHLTIYTGNSTASAEEPIILKILFE